MTSTQAIPSIRDAATLQNPYPVLDAMREATPVYRHPEFRNIAMVTRYEDVTRVLKDPETFSNDAYKELRSGGISGFASVTEVLATGFEPAEALAQTDGGVHDYHASMIQPFVSGRRLRAMSDNVQAIVDRIVDALPVGEPFDAVRDFAEPLSVTVMTDFVGVPLADRDVFVKGSDGEALLLGSINDEQVLIDAAKDYVALQQYAAAAIQDRRANPRDDVISSIANTVAPDGVEPSTLPQLVHCLKSVFTAGNETTRAALSASILRLVNQPELIDLIRDDDKVLDNFIEETLRADTPLLMLFRRATCDTEISGVPIAKGEVLAVVFAGANRDGKEFEEPLEFSLTRHRPRRHMSFGLGAHFCLGAPLARLEIKMALKAVLAKFESFALADAGRPVYAPSFFVHNLKTLPIVGQPRV